ncbi:MAG: site-specific DNA-methyltransferase, partial [Porticoccaceae bacterium]
MRAALEELRRLGSPYLQWTGKAERTSFEVDTVSLHVHERIDPMSILSAVSRARDGKVGKDGKKRAGGIQPGLFEAPFESLPLRDAVDFYRHDKGWSNRLIAGDSLLVMNSLLQKESMAGQVQMIYIDPPYGIKYGSNFQPFTNKRDVKDRADADLTQEPEMIKAFRDTWELGIHSYLTYLRDRLLLARELLADTGSVFVQISTENVHHVREVIDDTFGASNFVSQIAFRKTSGKAGATIDAVYDVLLWYAKSIEHLKLNPLFEERADSTLAEQYTWYVPRPGEPGSRLSKAQLASVSLEQRFKADGLFSESGGDTTRFPVDLNGNVFDLPGKWFWKTNRVGMNRLRLAGRLLGVGRTLCYQRFAKDFPVVRYNNLWEDTMRSGYSEDRIYVVQTGQKVIERCMMLTTDPGDLVLDPTCGSGTTAFVAEKWGRRWITCDTSRVAITLAKQRLMTASFDYYELRYPHEGLKGGFIYKTVPHITLKSIANNPEIDSIHERLHPAVESALAALNASLRMHRPSVPFTVADGVRKGETLTLGAQGADLHEWEVPFPSDDATLPAGWAESLREPFEAFHTARQRLQAAMDASIAAHADSETLYDQPEKAKNKLRITGPFSVEAVPFPTVLNLDATAT